jgi:hypothetical protein
VGQTILGKSEVHSKIYLSGGGGYHTFVSEFNEIAEPLDNLTILFLMVRVLLLAKLSQNFKFNLRLS